MHIYLFLSKKQKQRILHTTDYSIKHVTNIFVFSMCIVINISLLVDNFWKSCKISSLPFSFDILFRVWLSCAESGYFLPSLTILYGVWLFCKESGYFVRRLVILYGIWLFCKESGYFVRSLVLLYGVWLFVRSLVILYGVCLFCTE